MGRNVLLCMELVFSSHTLDNFNEWHSFFQEELLYTIAMELPMGSGNLGHFGFAWVTHDERQRTMRTEKFEQK